MLSSCLVNRLNWFFWYECKMTSHNFSGSDLVHLLIKILEFWKPKEISRKTYEMVLNYSTTTHFLFATLQKFLLNWFFIVASCKLIDLWKLIQIFTSKCWLLIKKCNAAILMFPFNLFLTSFETRDSVVFNYRWWKKAFPSEYSNEFANS